jgi:hypothetical protein
MSDRRRITDDKARNHMTTNNERRPPVIDGVNGKIAILERRLDHLSRRLERDEYASSASADFDRAEIGALRAAIKALQFIISVSSQPIAVAS